ncbi:family 2 glycosyltransferase [Cryphonectria parasitica EP155]|uniref:Chitin synthase n=1 Tax=Cryphonectria parasitica (strain ATCC 38755 / EP155) TaxID=660469 RepID=A0A9P5CJ38_CRYP1|nr:family 2 glycosyltransferase [Cryphonectria parasitica EP155]KAF3760788.1 family 2 glycosyltransferase [Cryphonectria parasitica EP155]
MSRYDRLDEGAYHQDHFGASMNPNANRTPSPGHPLQYGYQLDDNPYQHSDMPMGHDGRYTPADSIEMHQAHSIENMGSHYDQNTPYQDYSVNPEAHHDGYYNQPYDPQLISQGQDFDDRRPMLDHQHSDMSSQYQDSTAQQQQQQGQQQAAGGGLKRWKTVKEVLLYKGNLVLDCPVPPRLLSQVPHGERDEFTHMRYTAATCDPNFFYEENFTLRQKLFSKPRHTELFIVVTMYNEDEILFARTMIGVLKNVEYMCKRNESKTWGKDAWKKIVVCIVSDGRAKINPRTRALLAGMGVYQEGIAKQQVNHKDVTAHIYEYTSQVGMQIKNDVVQLIPKQQPVQLLFCLKEKNQKKINSHRWFFSAFGRVLDPNICVLIDAGTKPGGNSIYHLWKAFDLEPMCAGACGEIKAMLGTAGKNLVNPLVAAQNFEYKMSNILDKPLESAFGFISVLPGAFSAYRYVALQNDKNGQGPLEKYFAGEKLHGAGAGIFTANMYLAEDRILCFELVTKRNCHWLLQYVKSANGETDVPDTITELILQRRRWLNGSFFAAIYAIAHFYQFFRSDHSLFRKLAFFVEFTFNTINMIFAWFAIGNFFLVFKILTASLGDSDLLGTVGTILGVVFEWLYGISLMTCFVLSMGNRPAGSGPYYMAMVVFWAIIFIYLMFAAVFISVKAIETDLQDNSFSISELFKNEVFYTLIVSVMSTYGIWLIASLLMFDPWHMFTSLVQYMMLTPTFTNVLNVYAFCNTHDVSWGTKGDDKPDKLPSISTKDGQGKTDLPDEGDLNAQYDREVQVFSRKPVKEVSTPTPAQLDEKQQDYYRGVRTVVVLMWMITNFALIAVVLSAAGLEKIGTTTNTDTDETETTRTTIYMAVVLYSVAVLSGFKFLGAMWFLVVRMFRGV